MGCPSECFIGENLVFSICTHDPDTGVLTDADSAPTYRIYQDEDGTGTFLMSGSMAKLDDANTTGFYTELIAVTNANGFQHNKTYTIYVEATVDGDKGGIAYSFKAKVSEEIFHYGTAQTNPSPAANEMKLAAAASSVTDFYTSSIFYIYAGTGVGEWGLIYSYNGTTKIATFTRSLLSGATPDNTSKYVILTHGKADIVMLDGDYIAAETLKFSLKAQIQGKVNSTPGSATSIDVKDLSVDVNTTGGEADLNLNDLIKNRVLIFASGECRGQVVGIDAQAASGGSDPITLTVTTMVNYGDIAADDTFVIV